MDRPNHLKAWREFRGMTQGALAEAVGTNGSVISLLESGERRLSDKWLRKLAPALGTTPGYLLDHHPETLPGDLLEIWAAIPEERKAQAIEVLATFRKAASDRR
jgi:transcriptional regulator with XRE-family HTH domain